MGSTLSRTYSPSTPATDLVVVGGGASGVAILLQLIERAKKGQALKEVIFVEKNGQPGPGLPYSSQCTGTILNMHTDTMGLYHDNPLHFTQWRKDLESGPFPSRASYGEYLQAMWAQAFEEAQQLGLGVSVIHQEARDVDRQTDGTMLLTLQDGTQLPAKSVVLALGNFTSVCNTHLVNLPGFFPGPWPTSQLRAIPSDASVIIVGSRLSAVDAAIFLSANGHQGPITFMSRSGSLPKVQGESAPFTRRYALHDLARHIEENADENLLQVTSNLMEEIFHATNGDWSWLHNDESPVKQLEYDIHAAKTGRVAWQTVLRSTAPVIERYWNSLSTKSQQLFMDKFFSPWMRYRHGMPVSNAQKILKLLQKGQLQVVQGDRVHWDGTFRAQTSIGLLEAPYVIEATGQECQLDRIESPLIQSAVEKGLLTPHPAGGVAVDFNSLRASEGLYAIGSLTRGTHFYVSAIDRVAAHAARIADAVTQEPIARPLHIAIFLGSDLFSHLMASTLVPQLLAAGHTPFVFLPVHKANRKTTPPFELRELAFFERELLQKHVIPYFKIDKPQGAAHMTVEQMKSAYGILVQEVPNVNSASFINSLRKHHIDVGLSLRCYQRFKTDIIRYFSRPRRLLNLHPGTLPAYRGVMTTVRAMKNKETHFGYSLHDIDEEWDAGDLVEIRKHPIDYSKSMLHFMNDVYGMGAKLAADVCDKIARGKELPNVPQKAEESGYYTFPTKEDLEGYRQDGIRLVDAESIVNVIVESFAPLEKQEKFRAHIDEVVQKWYEQNRQ
ncbi:FAD-NAD(P)-binding-domain-containing protein [Aspergillus alliaceus]|uniref:FAD-NAD(P)-binding-domain-containing protein n=1 Tax=Petromyces alliaceus TaxID=209559 RepID=UPI0012A431F2|nr:FAD-NAD(P)-binding-domain-containing protein [Aspergillus alliaceus]KAB8234006.1 FAD-NAD(P)-binding-domain-containing protein [Aspergillus alliaceus]